MKFLDLFAGVGGIRLGMEQAGHSCVGWVEWDKFARKSYKAIHDTEGEYEGHDIKSVTGSELPTADIWAFGSPCTNISIAGNRSGLGGEQSSMFFEVMRLLREIDGKEKPKYLFMENVKSLLSSNRGWDFARVIFEMDEIGYDVEWDVFDSAEVVPQHRERIFIIGHLRGRSTRKVFPIVRKNGETNKTIKEVARIYPDRHSSDANSIIDPSGISHTVTAHSYKDSPKIAVREATKKGFAIAKVGDTINFSQPNSKTRRGRVVHGIANTMTTANTMATLTSDLRIRKLTPLECWRLQGFPDWAFDRAKQAGLSDSQLYKQAGNSVTVPVIKAIAEKMELED